MGHYLIDSPILCFGHFNAIHPGHIRYFQTARQYGNDLIVGLEGSAQLSEAERVEMYSETERAEALLSLDIVDYVVILDIGGLSDLVDCIKPKALVLGKEFEERRYEKVAEAVEQAEHGGGLVVYNAGDTQYATTDLLYASQHQLEKDRWSQFQSILGNWNIDLSSIVRKLKESKPARMLVLGDTILDQYVACDPIGMSNEAPVVVVKELETRNFIGGAAIVAAHVSELGADCKFISVTGDDEESDFVEKALVDLGVATNILRDSSRPTTKKIRYMVENQKLFRVSRLRERSLSKAIETLVVEKIEEYAPLVDGIVVCDFVYGLITPTIVETLQEVSKKYQLPLFGDLQCSSQIGNIGKFENFHLLCPTEREARIALRNQDDGVETIANLLREETQASNLIIKLGADGFIAYTRKKKNEFIDRQHFPALIVNPLDVAGAGDSLMAGVSVALTQGLTLIEASAISSCIAALAVQTVGNLPVKLEDLSNFIQRQQ